jgi:glutamine transport system permease protein
MTYYVNFKLVLVYFPDFLRGLGLGLWLAAISLFIGMILGLLIAFCAISKKKFLRIFSSGYVTVLRNIPLLVLTFFCYFGLPDWGVLLSKHASFVFALSLYAGAYLTEVFRAGLEGIPKGILEAGAAIGLHKIQIMQYLQMPIMIKNVLPSLSNNFISLFKDTSLASSIAVVELTYLARKVNTITFRVIEVWLIVGMMYMVTCYIIAFLLRLIEHKFRIQ